LCCGVSSRRGGTPLFIVLKVGFWRRFLRSVAFNVGGTDLQRSVTNRHRKMGPGGPTARSADLARGGSADLCLAPPGLGFGRWLPLWVYFFGSGAFGLGCVGL